MILAVTGTPGCGKTVICTELEHRGFSIIYLTSYLKEKYLLSEPEPGSDTWEVDVEKVREHFCAAAKERRSKEWIIIDSHLSHFLDVDAVVVLRCSPKVLKERLKGRDYSKKKIMANVECEMVDFVAAEVISTHLPAIELDTTCQSPEIIANDIVTFISSNGKRGEFPGPCSVDWLKWDTPTS